MLNHLTPEKQLNSDILNLGTALEKLNRPEDSSVRKIQQSKPLSEKDYGNMRVAYELWSRNRRLIPLYAYWTGCVVLLIAGHFAPQLPRNLWVLALAWVLGETYARSKHREGYRFGFEYGVNFGMNKAQRAARSHDLPISEQLTPERHFGEPVRSETAFAIAMTKGPASPREF